MNESSDLPKAYVLNSCPFCFKLVLFLSETGLLDKLELVVLDPEADDFGATKQALIERAGKALSFPNIETSPNQFKTETDDIIAMFAQQYDVDVQALPTLDYYQAGLMKKFISLFMENRELKKQLESTT